MRIGAQGPHISPRHDGADHGRPLDQGTGLAVLQRDDLIQAQGHVSGFRGNVQGLPKNHALGPGRLRHAQHQICAHRRILVTVRMGKAFEGQRLQGIAGQHGGSLVPFDMHGRPPPAQVIVIHARQIIMHEAVGMDHFDRGGRPDGMGRVHPVQPRAFHHQEGAQTLAALTCIAHRIRDLPFKRGHHGIQMRLHLCRHLLQPDLKHLQAFDRFQAGWLALAIQGDGGHLLLSFLQLGLAAFLQFGAAFVKTDRLVQRHIATFQLADNALQLFHRLFKAQFGYGPVGHALLSINTSTCAATEAASASRS